jgi:hypothetical protein
MSVVMFTEKPIGAVEQPNYYVEYSPRKGGKSKKLYFQDLKTANSIRSWARENGMFITQVKEISPLATGKYDVEALEWVEKSKAKRSPIPAKKLKSKGERLKSSKYTAQNYASGCCCDAKKKITGIDLYNPWIATALVAVGTYYLAKKTKLI